MCARDALEAVIGPLLPDVAAAQPGRRAPRRPKKNSCGGV
jgi:hypothetical protein